MRKIQRTNNLKVHSIFESISGEGGGLPQGAWCKFIRLQGCNLRCKWCDTEYSQEQGEGKGKTMSPQSILEKCKNHNRVLITGGEPLLQAKELVRVLQPLLERGCRVQIETNGSIEVPPPAFSSLPSIRGPIYWVMDYKCPSSGMSDKMFPIKDLVKQTKNTRMKGDLIWIKWVVADNEDLEFALDRIGEMVYEHGNVTPHLISPLDGKGGMLQEIIKTTKQRRLSALNQITFSVQMHKIFNLP